MIGKHLPKNPFVSLLILFILKTESISIAELLLEELQKIDLNPGGMFFAEYQIRGEAFTLSPVATTFHQKVQPMELFPNEDLVGVAIYGFLLGKRTVGFQKGDRSAFDSVQSARRKENVEGHQPEYIILYFGNKGDLSVEPPKERIVKYVLIYPLTLS